MELKEKFIMCSCYGHALHVIYDEDEDEYYLDVWQPSSAGKFLWSHRLQNMWKSFKGEPVGETVILDNKTASELAGFLNNGIKTYHQKEMQKAFGAK